MKKNILLLIACFFILQNANNIYAAGMEYYQNKDYVNSLLEFSEITAKNPQDLDAHFYMGMSQYHLGYYAQAKKSFSYIAYCQPEYKTAYYYLGATCFKLKEYKKAAKYYTIAAGYSQENPDIYYNLGLAYYYQQEYNQAIKALEKALILEPDSEEATFLLGMIYYKFYYLDDSRDCFEKVILNGTNDNLCIKAVAYLKKIETESRRRNLPNLFSFSTYLGSSFDDNISALPRSYSSASGLSDFYYTVSLSGQYQPSKTFVLESSISNYLYQKNSQFNYQSAQFGTSINIQLDKSFLLHLKYDFFPSFLDSKFYSAIHSVSPELEITESGSLATALNFEYDVNEYPDINNKYLNGYTNKYSIEQYFYTGQNSGYFKLGYAGGTQDLNDLSGSQYTYSYYNYTTSTAGITVQNYSDFFNSYSYNFGRFRAELYLPVSQSIYGFFNLSQETRTHLNEDTWYTGPEGTWGLLNNTWYKYDETIKDWVAITSNTPPQTTLHNKKRIDITNNITLGFTKILTNSLYLMLNYAYTQNISNLSKTDYTDYNYTTQVYSLSLQFNF